MPQGHVRPSQGVTATRPSPWRLSLILAVAWIGLAACERSASVSPGIHDVYLRSGKTDEFVLQVDLAQAPPSTEPLDVLFLLDRTASMSNVIDVVRGSAISIMEAVRGMSRNTAFGVASLGDYPRYGGTIPWQLNQALTFDAAAVVQALRGIVIENGGDLPEAYSRALYESQFVNWRPDARHFLILFGDAPAHDPDFYGVNLGIDPGADEGMGTPGGLRLREVVGQLAEKKITIISVYDTTPAPNKAMIGLAIRGFEYMAYRTGGLTKPIRSAQEVPQAIRAGIREQFLLKPRVLVLPPSQPWAQVGSPRKAADGNRRFHFPIILQPPPGTPDGIYRFPLIAVHGGEGNTGEIGRTWVTVRIGLWNYPWRWPFLLTYTLLLLGFGVTRGMAGRTSRGIRYERNGQTWTLIGRAGLILLALSVGYLIWVYAPGTMPEPPR